jgi:PTH1 family peptidyl-tRNA hydrolase
MNRLRLVYGLGNPGPVYEGTRHNLGAQAILFFAKEHGLSWRWDKSLGLWLTEAVSYRDAQGQKWDWVLARSAGFMNLSGQPLKKFRDGHPFDIENLLVVHDDARLFLGQGQWQQAGPLRGQNGLKSIVASLKEDGFCRLRLGVANEHCHLGLEDYTEKVASHVLGKFNMAEREKLSKLWPLACLGLQGWLEEQKMTNFFLPDEPIVG